MQNNPWPERFVDLKRQIVEATPDYEKRLTESWKHLLGELDKRTAEIAQVGPDVGACIFFWFSCKLTECIVYPPSPL
jgi:hypothetical protein